MKKFKTIWIGNLLLSIGSGMTAFVFPFIYGSKDIMKEMERSQDKAYELVNS